MQATQTTSLGERIARLRKQRDWTQDDFAAKIGIHSRHVSRLENDRMRPKAHTLARIAEVFEVSLDELLGTEPLEDDLKDPQLLRIFQQAQDLDDEDKTMVGRFVQALITNKRVQQALQQPFAAQQR